MNSTFCGVNAAETSFTALPFLYNCFSFVLILKISPVFTSYSSSKTASPSASLTTLPSASFLITQFFRSKPIPPVTPTVVKKIGAIPLVPAITGAMLMKGTYSLALTPVHNATLFTPDILEEPTPIVPFSATNITLLSACFSFN